MTEVDRPAFEDRAADWLTAAEAQRRILDTCPTLPWEEIAVADALGRALAEDIHASATLPPWDNAAMDGYAVRGVDVAGATTAGPRVLAVRASVRAGGSSAAPVGPGEAVRIMTGAPLPPGADSVIRVEDTDAEAEAGQVRVFGDRDVLRNVRAAGEDFRPGDPVLRRGQAVHAGTVAVLASLGRNRVRVGRRPVVAVLTTGDELRTVEDYGDVVAGGGIPECNGPMLAAAVAAAGGVPRLVGPVSDTLDALASALASAAGADVLVTVGGASVGEADLVKRALDRAGYVHDFWRVAMRPGSPFSVGRVPRREEETLVFGLPGNPASAFVTFEILVRPCLLRMAGHARIHRRRVTARAGAALQAGRRTAFARVLLEAEAGALVAYPAGPQGSGLVGGLAAAQGLAVLPAGSSVAPGGAVDVLLLDPDPAATARSPLEGLAT